MPILASDCNPRFLYKGSHRQTILPNIFRRVKLPGYHRERIPLPDGDFVEVDWLKNDSKKLVVALHGMEGNSQRQYIKGILSQMYELGWDGLGFNFRGCSGTPNILARSYHCGETKDIGYVLEQICSDKNYETIVIVGFSLGGNVALLYSAQQKADLHEKIKAVVAVSVPCDLPACVPEISRPTNILYLNRFMKGLKDKVRSKEDMYRHLDLKRIYSATNFQVFDDAFTAPVHGFASGEDYWKTVASLPHLEAIRIPALILNAQDDTFLSKSSTPMALAKSSSLLHVMHPANGGHVGFFEHLNWKKLWSERQIAFFLTEIVGL